VTRLLDLEIPPFLITSTVVGIMAQRLVRMNCTHCAEAREPTEEEAAALRLSPEKLKGHAFRTGKGCLNCRQTGFSGRDGIFEVMAMSEPIKQLVTDRASAPQIFAQARKEGMRTLREAAVEKVLKGVTTVAEVVRVTGQ
jgi:type II secretory ATPase GspE/PulE/Tfp pilus assembly ATPase PilB-like protein